MSRKAKIAVVLSGCGVNDGTEIHEAVLTLLAIDRHGALYQCFAPNIPQYDVVDHASGKVCAETRNVLVESARIARGDIADLADLQAESFDGLIFPGGFGAAKNLTSFAVHGAECTVEPSVARAVRAMHAAGKPIGALCIAPAILARVLGAVELTIGDDAETAAALERMGAHHRVTDHGEVVVDRAARIVTAPCYMLPATISQIAEDADNMVRALLEMAPSRAKAA
jgi:enhancing lycopene biosynthesis protein 2